MSDHPAKDHQAAFARHIQAVNANPGPDAEVVEALGKLLSGYALGFEMKTRCYNWLADQL